MPLTEIWIVYFSLIYNDITMSLLHYVSDVMFSWSERYHKNVLKEFFWTQSCSLINEKKIVTERIRASASWLCPSERNTGLEPFQINHFNPDKLK